MSADTTPRAWTADEIRDQIIASIWDYVQYWEGIERPKAQCLQGLAHSILAMLDGAADLPGFKLIPTPHPDDEEYNRSEGENWYSPATAVEDMLHEHFYRGDLRRDR